MEALSRENLFPKVVEAYSRPTRIVRGKDVDTDMKVLFLRWKNDVLLIKLIEGRRWS
jgi:hypothetical protein